MAGLGWKQIVAGSEALASDAQGYFMDQTIMHFVDSTERATATDAIASQGMFSYLNNNASVDHWLSYHTGSGWVNNNLGGWLSYTPSFTNFTLGNGTIAAQYSRFGKVINVRVKVTLGSTSSMGTSPTVGLPVSSSVSGLAFNAYLSDASAADFIGTAYISSATQVSLRAINTAATYATQTSVTAAIPMTWTNTDSFSFSITYEAA